MHTKQACNPLDLRMTLVFAMCSVANFQQEDDDVRIVPYPLIIINRFPSFCLSSECTTFQWDYNCFTYSPRS